MSKYKKCHDCDFFENRCYTCGTVIPLCNKYRCTTDPEWTCLRHKKHDHRNYDPELYASLPGVTKTGAGSFSPPFSDVFDVSGPRHHNKTEKGGHNTPAGLVPPSSSLSPSRSG